MVNCIRSTQSYMTDKNHLHRSLIVQNKIMNLLSDFMMSPKEYKIEVILGLFRKYPFEP